MLAVTGYNSRIVQELTPLLPEGEEVVRIGDVIPKAERYVFCAGLLRPKHITAQSSEEIAETMHVNCFWPLKFCENIFGLQDDARICVIGSESGFSWSYDGAYAAAKAALHCYVETKKLKPGQQLVCVAPSIIEDAGMTLRREDHENLERRQAESPKKRFLRAAEVAKLVHFLLYVDEGYLSGQVIRMNGGV